MRPLKLRPITKAPNIVQGTKSYTTLVAKVVRLADSLICDGRNVDESGNTCVMPYTCSSCRMAKRIRATLGTARKKVKGPTRHPRRVALLKKAQRIVDAQEAGK